MSRIFWDTNLFVYLFEEYKDLSQRTIALRRRMMERGDQLFTSTMTLGEILVKPWQRGDHATCRKYEENLTRGSIVIAFDLRAARIYATLRSRRSLKAPDSVQLACAAGAGIDLFITNDDRLEREQVPGIQFIVSLNRAPL